MKRGEGAGELNSLPLVTYWDREMQETTAVLRALGADVGLYDPRDWKKAAKIDMILATYTECMDLCCKIYFKTRPEKQHAEIEALTSGFLLKFLNMCEIELSKNLGSFFLVGDQLSIADFAISAFFQNVIHNRKGMF